MSDFLKTAGGILASLAPTVATALGGPFAGMATTAMLNALGLSPDTSKDDMMKAIASATPEQLIELKKVEQQFIIDLKRLDVDVMKLDAGDRDSARKREIETQDYTPRILAAMILGLYIAVQYYVFGGHILDISMRDIAMRSLGTLDAALTMVLAYYFGSSSGSRAKDNQINSMVENARIETVNKK